MTLGANGQVNSSACTPQRSKFCPQCSKPKPIAEFSSRDAAEFKPTSYCKSCQRTYCRMHYITLKELHNTSRYARQQLTRARNREFVDAYLRDRKCIDCGECDVRLLEFDHVLGQKVDCISEMIYHSTPEKLAAELKKCEIRCANCHRRRTANQRGWKKALAVADNMK